MSVLVYAATDPCRAEIEIDGEVFTAKTKTFADALHLAHNAIKALGLEPIDARIGTITIDGKPLAFTAPESKL